MSKSKKNWFFSDPTSCPTSPSSKYQWLNLECSSSSHRGVRPIAAWSAASGSLRGARTPDAFRLLASSHRGWSCASCALYCGLAESTIKTIAAFVELHSAASSARAEWRERRPAPFPLETATCHRSSTPTSEWPANISAVRARAFEKSLEYCECGQNTLKPFLQGEFRLFQ